MSEKDTYLATAKARLDEQIAKLDLLKEKAKDEFDEQKENIQELIADLEEKVTAGKTYIGELSDAAEEKWDHVKESFEASSDYISGTIDKLFKRVKKTRDPEKTGIKK
ncbi:hypothetical protein KJ966_14405 [bacterium]|nr:hypothetical protein [bacterium]